MSRTGWVIRPVRNWMGCVRIDQEEKRTHGWQARYRRAGQTLTRFFSDKKYGGTRAARRQAEQFLSYLDRAFRRDV